MFEILLFSLLVSLSPATSKSGQCINYVLPNRVASYYNGIELETKTQPSRRAAVFSSPVLLTVWCMVNIPINTINTSRALYNEYVFGTFGSLSHTHTILLFF